MFKHNKLLLSLLLISTLTSPLFAKVFNWKALETDNFIVYYLPELEATAKKTLEILESHRLYAVKFTGNDFKKLPIVIEDMGLTANGYSNPLVNKVGLFTGFPGARRQQQESSYLRRLIVHELTHAAQFTKISGQHKRSRSFFGNFFYPNLWTPSWLLEGFAVYNESQVAADEGRLNDGYFHALVGHQTLYNVADNFESFNSPFLKYPRNRAYLYGSLFTEFLAKEYGEESLTEFIDMQSIEPWAYLSLLMPSWSLDEAAKKVFGKSFMTLYHDFQDTLKKRAKSIDNPGYRRTRTGWEKQFLTAYQNKLYYSQFALLHTKPRGYKSDYHIVAYDPEEDRKEVVKAFVSPITSYLQFHDNHLYYTRAQSAFGYANVGNQTLGNSNVLFKLNLKTKKEKAITAAPIDAFAILDDARVIYSTHQPAESQSTLWEHTQTGPVKLAEIDIYLSQMLAHNGMIYMIGKTHTHSWDAYQFDISTKTLSPLIQSKWMITSLSVDGNTLVFTSNQNQRYRGFSYNLNSKTITPLTQGSFANHTVVLEDNIFYIGFSKYGEDLYSQPFTQENAITLTPHDPFLAPDTPTLSYKEVPALKPALKSLFPYSRLPLYGEDHLSLIDYDLSINRNGDFKLAMNTRLFTPLTLGIAFEDEDAFFKLSRPFYHSDLEGVQSLRLGFQSNFDDKHYPFIHSNASYPWVDVKGTGLIDLKLGGYLMKGQAEIPILSVLLRANATIHDKFDTDHNLRGLDFYVTGDVSGKSLSLELTHKLYSLNKSMWHPNLAIGTIFGSLFYDYGSYFEGFGDNYTWGYEVSAEVSLAEQLYLVPSFGIASAGGNFEKFNSLTIYNPIGNHLEPFFKLSLDAEF